MATKQKQPPAQPLATTPVIPTPPQSATQRLASHRQTLANVEAHLATLQARQAQLDHGEGNLDEMGLVAGQIAGLERRRQVLAEEMRVLGVEAEAEATRACQQKAHRLSAEAKRGQFERVVRLRDALAELVAADDELLRFQAEVAAACAPATSSLQYYGLEAAGGHSLKFRIINHVLPYWAACVHNFDKGVAKP